MKVSRLGQACRCSVIKLSKSGSLSESDMKRWQIKKNFYLLGIEKLDRKSAKSPEATETAEPAEDTETGTEEHINFRFKELDHFRWEVRLRNVPDEEEIRLVDLSDSAGASFQLDRLQLRHRNKNRNKIRTEAKAEEETARDGSGRTRD